MFQRLDLPPSPAGLWKQREPAQVGVLERGSLNFWTWNEVQKKYTYS